MIAVNKRPENQIFAAVTRIASPEFTRELTWDEQMALTDEQFGRYFEWRLFMNSPKTHRWYEREYMSSRELDKPIALASGETWEISKKQSGTNT